MGSRETILIVGAGQAGAWVATTLRAEGFEGRIILAGAEIHPPYERPLLSKGILNGAPPARALLRAASDYVGLEIDWQSGVRVTSLDLDKKAAKTEKNSSIYFDRLVLATGSVARRLPVPGAELANVQYLRTLDDALALRQAFAGRPRIVIIGGGFIGLEVAAVARTLGCPVTILEADNSLLGRVAPPEIGAYFGTVHRERGVFIHFQTAVERMEGTHKVERVVCKDGRCFDADLVVVAVGARPVTDVAATAGLAVSDGIVVDSLGTTSHSSIFAAGDVSNHPNPFLQRRVRLESWQNAQNQAIAVGKAMAGKVEPYADLPWFWSDQYDINLQIAGLPKAWDKVVTRGDSARGEFSAFYLLDDRVVGLSTVNRPKDMSIGRRLIEQGGIVAAGQLRDEAFPLKKLLRR